MRKNFVFFLLLLPLWLAAGVSEYFYTWHDDWRDRDVPVKIYLPEGKEGQALPVILFSHGLGGSCKNYQYLGQNWAQNDLVSVHVEHPGSNTASFLKNPSFKALQRAAANPDNIRNRPQDMSFALDTLTKLNEDKASPLYHRLDLKHVGAAGHSFGAYTALAAAGLAMYGPMGQHKISYQDPRFAAVIAMSAPFGKGLEAGGEKTFADITIPCMLMTGTRDDSPIGDTKAADRKKAYDLCHMEKYEVDFQGGDHAIFSGRKERDADKESLSDAEYQKAIVKLTLLFWRAYLCDDAKAKQTLQSPQLVKEMTKIAAIKSAPAPTGQTK